MNCPTCKTTELKPSKLAEGLPGFTCSTCDGYLIEILSYRIWSERHATTDQKPVNLELSEPVDSKQVLVCPQCHKLMTKFLLSDKSTNKIDLCVHCGRFWIDGGEWALLQSLNLDTNLTKIFNEPWQKAIRQARVLSEYEKRLRDTLSDDDYEQLVQLRDWIYGHPMKTKLLDYLNHFQS